MERGLGIKVMGFFILIRYGKERGDKKEYRNDWS